MEKKKFRFLTRKSALILCEFTFVALKISRNMKKVFHFFFLFFFPPSFAIPDSNDVDDDVEVEDESLKYLYTQRNHACIFPHHTHNKAREMKSVFFSINFSSFPFFSFYSPIFLHLRECMQ
jgi:hypothetical protein